MKKIIIFLIVAALGLLGFKLFFNKIANKIMEKQGVRIEILKSGSGFSAKAHAKVTVNYTGTLENGAQFDSSAGKVPFTFTLGAGQVIKGWDIGVEGMKVGEKRKLTIPPDLGYGAQGAGNVIPPNATLIFEVEVLGISQ